MFNCNSAVRVQASHENRKIDMTSALNKLILAFRQMFSSLQMGLIIDIAAIVCAAHDKISDLDSMITEEGSRAKRLSQAAQTTAAMSKLRPSWRDKNMSEN